ncbi:MAG: hypothetical protein JWN99_1881 [Ilumatobacteraceae bacterium]|nr:hypothetical protein [Ilumatobacteraceae bacterium]
MTPGLPLLSDSQRALADARARCTISAADEQARLQPDGFVSVRDTRATALRMGTAVPDHRAERSMLRAAGVGRFATTGALGEWESLVNAAYESARFHREPIDLDAVSQASLAWCLAGRPSVHPIAALATLSRDIATDDVHDEQVRPSYRQLLDGWRALLRTGV